MNDADQRSNNINAEYQSRVDNMDKIYSKYKEQVVDKVVDFLVDSDN